MAFDKELIMALDEKKRNELFLKLPNAKSPNEVVEILKDYNIEISEEEAKELIDKASSKVKVLDDKALGSVNGGCSSQWECC